MSTMLDQASRDSSGKEGRALMMIPSMEKEILLALGQKGRRRSVF